MHPFQHDVGCGVAYYFNRIFNEYENGFGFTNKEYWIGLKNMLQLKAILKHLSWFYLYFLCTSDSNLLR